MLDSSRFSQLPREVFWIILEFVTPKGLWNLSKTSKRYRAEIINFITLLLKEFVDDELGPLPIGNPDPQMALKVLARWAAGKCKRDIDLPAMINRFDTCINLLKSNALESLLCDLYTKWFVIIAPEDAPLPDFGNPEKVELYIRKLCNTGRLRCTNNSDALLFLKPVEKIQEEWKADAPVPSGIKVEDILYYWSIKQLYWVPPQK